MIMIKGFGVFTIIITILTGCVISRGTEAYRSLHKKKHTTEVASLIIKRFGRYLDKEEDELRRRLHDTGVTVSRLDDQITLNIISNIAFMPGNGYELDEGILPVLDSIAAVLNKFNSTLIEVSGHTDSIGTLKFNIDFSKKRADIIMNELISRNVTQHRIHSKGLAYERPLDTNDTQEGRKNNQRIEIKIYPSYN